VTELQTLSGAGVELAYEERGSGPPVVLVHGMGDDRTSWRPFAEELADVAHVVLYDRRGYGDSSAPEHYARTTINEQAEDLAALMDGLGLSGALLCGLDIGALVVLDVLIRHGARAAGAVLVDPPLFMLVRDATEPLAAERAALEQALRDGGPPRAVEAWLEPAAPDPARTARARLAARAFFADYGGLATLPIARATVRAITVPVDVTDGARSAPHVRAAADALAQLLPDARRLEGVPLADVVRERVAAGRRP